MSPRLPAVSGAELVRALLRADFELTRIKGSHHFLRHGTEPGRAVSIPVHGSRTLKRGTLLAVLKRAKVPFDELKRLL